MKTSAQDPCDCCDSLWIASECFETSSYVDFQQMDNVGLICSI
jgi:hypothetical protein